LCFAAQSFNIAGMSSPCTDSWWVLFIWSGMGYGQADVMLRERRHPLVIQEEFMGYSRVAA